MFCWVSGRSWVDSGWILIGFFIDSGRILKDDERFWFDSMWFWTDLGWILGGFWEGLMVWNLAGFWLDSGSIWGKMVGEGG